MLVLKSRSSFHYTNSLLTELYSSSRLPMSWSTYVLSPCSITLLFLFHCFFFLTSIYCLCVWRSVLWRWNPGCQAWWQAPVTVEPSRQSPSSLQSSEAALTQKQTYLSFLVLRGQTTFRRSALSAGQLVPSLCVTRR